MRPNTAISAAEVTPDDDVALSTVPTLGLWVGSTGDLTVKMNGANITFANVPAGYWMPIAVTHVLDTGTTASDIVAVW